MTLPKKAEKEYLEITPTEGGFTILAEEQHASALQALFQQHDIPCRIESTVQPGDEALVFSQEADVTQAREVLDAYKHAKGS